MDLGTIQYDVAADTTDIDKANAAVDNMAEHMNEAGIASDSLGKKINSTAKESANTATSVKKATDSMKQSGNAMRQVGFQFQDAVVQLQGGQNAFLVFSQQGSQLFSVIHPLLGLAASLAGVLGGALYNALTSDSKATEDLADQIKKLHKEYRDLDVFQRQYLVNIEIDKQKAAREEIAKTEKNINDLTDAYNKLSLAQGKKSFVNTFATGGVFTTKATSQELVDKEKQLTAARANLSTQNDVLAESEKEIQRARGLNVDGDKKALTETESLIAGLKDQAAQLQITQDLIKSGGKDTATATAAYAQMEANKTNATKAQKQEIIGLVTSNEATKEKNKSLQEADTLFKQQDKSAKDRLLSMQREIDLFGVTSKYQQLEYDIKSGLIKVNGGINSQQAKEMLNRAEILVQLEKQATLTKNLEEIAFAGYDNSKGDLDSAKMQYELDNGILKVNKDLTKEYYEQQIANKKIEESKINQKKIDDYIKNQQAEIDKSGMTETEKLRYDIAHNILYVEGGITSEKAKQAIANQAIIDSQNQQLELTKSIKDGITTALMQGAANGKNIFENLRSTIEGIFQTMVLKPSLDIVTDQLAKSVSSVLGSVGQKDSKGNLVGASGALGAVGPYGAIAAAVAVAAVGAWNSAEDKKFEKLTAAYKQGTQSTGTILGDANKQSQSINNSIDKLTKYSDNTLGVNQDMLSTLIDIREGIAGVAAGFAKTLTGSSNYKALGISEGKSTSGLISGGLATSSLVTNSPLLKSISGTLNGFISGVINKVSSAVYSKSKKVIDSGIEIVGSDLGDIMSGAALQAFNYADVKTTKKILGITASSKLNRSREDLDSVFEKQITDVFASAGDSLKIASKSFGIDFDSYIDQLKIKSQDLSLKGLTGDALTGAIQSFFSSTLDNWASVLLTGTDILNKYQQVGEGAFETFVRLASETETVMDYVDKLGLNLHTVGVASVDATQGIADAIGGFDALGTALSSYADKFLTDQEKFDNAQSDLTGYFSSLGLALPGTREAFEGLVKQADLATTAGQQQFAALIKVNGAVDDYISQLEAQAAATKQAKKELIDNSMSSLQRAVDAQKAILDKQISTLNDSLTASKSVYSALSSSLNGLVIDSKNTQAATRKQAQSQLKSMLSDSKIGKLPNIDDLNSALSVISKPSENLYGTFQEYATDFYKTADTIKQLQDAAGTQVSTEQQSLDELTKQSTSLDDLLTWAKQQVDILNLIDVSVVSVGQALSAFTAATGVADPVNQNQVLQKMAADSSAMISQTPAQQAADQAAQKQIDDQKQMQKDFQDFMKASQISISSNTKKTADLLEKFDNIGMPPERTTP